MNLNLTFIFAVFSTALTGILCLLTLKLKGRKGSLSFSILCLFLTLWTLGKLLKNHLFIHDIYWAEFWSRVSFMGSAGLTPTFFVLTQRISKPRHSFFKYLLYLAPPLYIGLLTLDFFGLVHHAQKYTKWGWNSEAAAFYPLFLFIFFLYLFLGFYNLYPKRRSNRWTEQRQSQFLFWGIITSVVLGLPEFYTILVGPAFPISDLAPASFSAVLYLGIFRYDYIGGQSISLNLGIRALYYLALTCLLTLGIWIFQNLVIDNPDRGWLLTSVGAILIIILTPMITKINSRLQELFFPVKAQFLKSSKLLNSKLSQTRRIEDGVKLLIDLMDKELHYEELKYHPSIPASLKNYAPIFSKRKLFSQIRYSKDQKKNNFEWWPLYKFLVREKTDIAIPLYSNRVSYGIICAKESNIGLEHWKSVHPLLESLAQKVADHFHILEILDEKHRQEQIAEIGLMAAQLAHEIKNPLGGIYGAVQLLKDEDPENPFIDIIAKDSQRLNTIVQNFLDFARPQSLKISEIDICIFLNELIRTQSAKKNHLLFSTELNSLKLKFDPHALNQVFENLIQNTHRHGQFNDEPKIEISLTQNLDSAQIKFRNFGPTISDANLDRIFKPFFSTHSKGNGLGLAYCQKLMHLQNGQILFQNENPGVSFTLILKK